MVRSRIGEPCERTGAHDNRSKLSATQSLVQHVTQRQVKTDQKNRIDQREPRSHHTRRFAATIEPT
jgi:hypothetical protein